MDEMRTLFTAEVLHLYQGYYVPAPAQFSYDLTFVFGAQLLLRSKTRYYSRGSIIADSRENASALIVITAGQVSTNSIIFDIFRPN